ncbi:von Willebrand factor type A domain-containing protein [Cercophora newfieldiana]|uniref:von Willebrand factor type A domain-containing protein n=1 Tax=Cercophora newfieldiana TaxID=92897 RepID=A0AA39YJ54_9PEZI|nr:von Willebrand factor type A domain-containing protein [Cercophora newfieldiana]
MPSHLGRIFAAGIVWDPREPLPPELRAASRKSRQRLGLGLSAQEHDLQDREFPRDDDESYHQGGRIPATAPFDTSIHAHQILPRNFIQFSNHTLLRPFETPFAEAKPPNAERPPTRHQKPPSAPNLQDKDVPAFTVQELDRNVLPPLSISFDASIVQDTAKVSVTQTFWNDSRHPIKEASYTFPLPAGCSVTEFSCRIGTNRIIKGDVKPKKEARAAFDRHIRTKDTGAALLEENTPEVFTAFLGNIRSKTRIKVNIVYITVLKHRFGDRLGTTTLTIPTYIASRYGSAAGDAAEDNMGNISTTVPDGLTLKIEIVESEKVRSIDSHTHNVAVERRLGKENADDFADLAGEADASKVEVAVVILASGSSFLDRDFVLDIVTEHRSAIEKPQAWLEEHPTVQGHRALMLTLPSQFFGHTRISSRKKGEILFLADRSASMEDKIDSLKSAMMFFLKGIPEGRKFNIWSFGSTYSSWMPESVNYTDANLNSALSYVRKRFRANKGGTEILPAVQAIVKARDRSMTTDVVILTDGQTWRLEQTLDYIQREHKRTEGRIRFFSLGIGDGVSHALVEGIAKAGGGYAEVVPSSIRDGWEDRVVGMLKAALTTEHLGPLYLEFEYRDRKGKTKALNARSLPDILFSPADVATLTPFNHNRVYCLLSQECASQKIESVAITAPTGSNTSKSVVVPVVRLEKKDTTIHKLAARSLLDDLERGRSYLHVGPDKLYPGTREEKALVRKEAEAIACRWSLVSKWTSFFLAEEPFEPKGNDPFMDNVIDVIESPGDDLLQTRGDAKLFMGSLEAPPRGSANMQLEDNGSSSTNMGLRVGALVSPGSEDENLSGNTASGSVFQLRRGATAIYQVRERRSSPPPPETSMSPPRRYVGTMRERSEDPSKPAPAGSYSEGEGLIVPHQTRLLRPTSDESEEHSIWPQQQSSKEFRRRREKEKREPSRNDMRDSFDPLSSGGYSEGLGFEYPYSGSQFYRRESQPLQSGIGPSPPTTPPPLPHAIRTPSPHGDDNPLRERRTPAPRHAMQQPPQRQSYPTPFEEAQMMVGAGSISEYIRPPTDGNRVAVVEDASENVTWYGTSRTAQSTTVPFPEKQSPLKGILKQGTSSKRAQQMAEPKSGRRSPEQEVEEKTIVLGERTKPLARSRPNSSTYVEPLGQPARRPATVKPETLAFRPPPSTTVRVEHPRSSMEGEFDRNGHSLFGDMVPYCHYGAMPTRQQSRRHSRRRAASFHEFEDSDTGVSEDRVPLSKSHHRAAPSPWRDAYTEEPRASYFQYEVAEPRRPLIEGEPRKGGSWTEDDSDHRVSAATRTTRSGDGGDDITIKVKGSAAKKLRETQTQTQTDFVRQIVGYQRSNGCFDFGSDANEEACLGRDVVAKASELIQALGWDSVRVQVAIIIVLLRRDFQSCKSYWDLAESKAVGYLKSRERALGEVRGSYKDGLVKAMEVLEGVSVPYLTSGTSSAAQTKRKTSRKIESEESDVSDGSGSRQLVTHAPMD